jgi:hypothetical protein
MMDQKRERPVVHVRVVSTLALVEEVATRIGETLVEQGYELIEQTALYPDRNDPERGRVFLTVR